jgi:nitrogen fixation protein FixH
MTASTFRLTGRHVLAIIIAFFLSIIAANAIFITLAIKSFPGEQEKKSYLQGLAFNDRITERNAQASLGWTAEISDKRNESGDSVVTLIFTAAPGAPVSGLKIVGLMARPADDESDHALRFDETEPGRYIAVIDGAEPGAWRLQAVATNESGDKFALEKRLILE